LRQQNAPQPPVSLNVMPKGKEQNREAWVDIAKAFCIMAIVQGHIFYMNWTKPYNVTLGITYMLYWFHIPAFLMLSGYLYKSLEPQELGPWVKNRTRRLLVPYASFIVLLYPVALLLNNQTASIPNMQGNLLIFLWGGKVLAGIYSIMWFITCLYLTQVIFACVETKLKKRDLLILFICAVYLFAHLLTSYLQNNWGNLITSVHKVSFLSGLGPEGLKYIDLAIICPPLSIDVVPLAVAYYGLGYLAQPYLKDVKKIAFILLPLSLCIIYYLGIVDNFAYRVDLRLGTYNHLFLDLVVPVVLSLALFSIAQYYAATPVRKFLAYIGQNTMVIMYLHFAVIVTTGLFKVDALVMFLACLTVPIAISALVFERFAITRILFLGSYNEFRKER